MSCAPVSTLAGGFEIWFNRVEKLLNFVAVSNEMVYNRPQGLWRQVFVEEVEDCGFAGNFGGSL